MRLFFLSYPLPDNICIAYKAKTLLLLNSRGGISHHSVEPTVLFHEHDNVLRIAVLSNASTNVIKHFLSFLKIHLVKRLSVFARGYKKQITLKGLGYRAEFFMLKKSSIFKF